MKKYLVGLFVIFSFLFIVGAQPVEAKKCCCAMTIMQSNGEFGVSTSSTRVYNTDQASSCVSQCSDELFALGGDFLQYEIVSNDDATPAYCYEDRYLGGKMNDSDEIVNFDTYLGCAVVDGGKYKHYLEVFMPRGSDDSYNGNLFEGILIERVSDFTSSYPKTMLAADELLDNKIADYFITPDATVYEKFNGIFPVNRRSSVYLDSDTSVIDPNTGEITSNISALCDDLYEKYRNNPQGVQYKFTQYPSKDTLTIYEIESIDGNVITYAGVLEGEIQISTGVVLPISVLSNFLALNIEYTWSTSSPSVVSISSNNDSEIEITAGNSGGAIITVKSNYGGEARLTIKNIGIGMSDTVAKVKDKCLELARTSNNSTDLVASCDDIGAGTTEATALLKCKEAAVAVDDETKIPDREAQCDSMVTNAPITGGEEGTGNELYNSMVDQIKRFSSSGLVGTDKSVPLIIGSLLKYVFGIVGSVAFAIFIYGGLSYMFSGGDKKKLTAAKDTFLWAALGLVAIFLSYSILNFVISKL